MSLHNSQPNTGQLEPRNTRLELVLRRQLGWVIGLRLLAVTSIVVPYFLLQFTASADGLAFAYLYRAAGAVYAASLIYLVLQLLRRPGPKTQAYIQFVGDLVLITGLVYYFGGTASPFSILYLIVITLASVLLRRRAGIHVASLAWLMYAAVALAIVRGWVHPPGLDPNTDLTFWRFAYYLAIHFVGFYAVAFMTSQLAQNVAQAERALRQKGERLAELRVAYRDVIESIPSGLVTTDPTGFITSANAAAQFILEKPAIELINRPIFDLGLFDQENWQKLRVQAEHGRERLETPYRAGDRELMIGYSLSPLTQSEAEPSGYILIFQDLSEWKKLQEEMRLQERMAAVGQMASGLAHEIGNPLAAISGSVQMLSSSVSEQTPQRKLLDIILKESQRLDRTIKGFLRFAKPKEASNVRFDVGALVSENVELLRNSPEVYPGHRIELELQQTSVSLVGDPDQISQIFWNLVRNSLRAMPDGGLLRVLGRLEEDRFQLDVVDTGRGMTAEEKARMFHPFRSYFDGGSGIGMAIVYRIVEEHGGEVRVDSKPGEGTRVRVELPGAIAEVTPLPALA